MLVSFRGILATNVEAWLRRLEEKKFSDMDQLQYQLLTRKKIHWAMTVLDRSVVRNLLKNLWIIIEPAQSGPLAPITPARAPGMRRGFPQHHAPQKACARSVLTGLPTGSYGPTSNNDKVFL